MNALLALGMGVAWSAPRVPTGLAWEPAAPALVVARVQTEGFAVVLDAPGLEPVRAPAVLMEVAASCQTLPAGRRQTTTCETTAVRVLVESGLEASVDATLQAWSERWSQATVELEHTLSRRPTRLDVLLPPEPGLGSDAAAHREQTDRLLGAAVSQCLGFEVPETGRGNPDGLSWIQSNLAGVPALPLRVHVPPSGRWRRVLKRRGPSISARGSALWTGGRVEDSVLVYTVKDLLDGSEARVAHSCRVVEALPLLPASGRADRLPSLPDPASAALLPSASVQ